MNTRENQINTTNDVARNISSYAGQQDYIEGALSKKCDIFFGSRQHLEKYYMSIDEAVKNNNVESSPYYGCVLYPERTGEWTPEKNKAFWAGAIETKRTLRLITDITQYPNKKREVSGTISEILWLKTAGYTFAPDPNDQSVTIASPPSQLRDNIVLKDYKPNDSVALNEFKEIRNEVINKRNQQKLGSRDTEKPTPRLQQNGRYIQNKKSTQQRCNTNKSRGSIIGLFGEQQNQSNLKVSGKKLISKKRSYRNK